MRGKILSMGEALVDVLPAADGLWRPVAGGSSLNVALALGRLGAPTAFAGRLSRDEQGQSILESLQKLGIAVDLVALDDRPSPLSLIERGSETGNARYSIYLSDTAHAPPELPANWMNGVAHLHVSSFSAVSGTWGEAVGAALRAVRGRIPASYDINIRPALLPARDEALELIEARVAFVDIVKASEDDFGWLFPNRSPGESADEWAQRFSCLVLLTQGARGATAYGAGQAIHAAAPRVSVADTVGAGDAFMAAFLARAYEAGRQSPTWRDAAELEEWLGFANRAAALCCARRGADPPTRAEVDAFRTSP